MKLHDLSHLSELLSKEEAEALAKEADAKQAKRKLGEGQEVRVYLDKKARRGKAVTVIEGLRLSTEMRISLRRRSNKNSVRAGPPSAIRLNCRAIMLQRLYRI